jgi:hypothetical protein
MIGPGQGVPGAPPRDGSGVSARGCQGHPPPGVSARGCQWHPPGMGSASVPPPGGASARGTPPGVGQGVPGQGVPGVATPLHLEGGRVAPQPGWVQNPVAGKKPFLAAPCSGADHDGAEPGAATRRLFMTTEQPNGRAPPVTVAWPAVTDFAEAVRLRDLLQGEAGHPYQVHPSGDGFVVARAGASADERAPRHGIERNPAR